MYRLITGQEVSELEKRGCSSSDWSKIKVKEGFSPGALKDVQLEGEICLGVFDGKTSIGDGIFKTSGIRNSYLENCIVGDNVFISRAGTLANYDIADNAAIENVGTLVVTGETTFGNGTEIEVFNEGGGRELVIFDMLTAQIAYLMVVYRHDKPLIAGLREMINTYCSGKRSARGQIGENARILNSLIIRNVNIGDSACITGASILEEGTISSCSQAPVFIGENVVAKKFIVLSGTSVDSGAILTSGFVGQGVKIGKQFSAENSAFFANCEGFHGEACSLFAGPYSVSHHKSTLLIACMLSFYNAGSGTNQSNHMYKLGPLHQGILERGSKTGSFSYLLWPCRIGPFSVVMDKHSGNFDTTDFPFSYINVENGRSVLTPAMNLFTVGTVRDSEKWPGRDRRKDPEKLDLIHFDLFSPYIIGKIMNAIRQINALQETASKNLEYVTFNGIQINRLMLKTSKRYYEIPVHIYIGQEIVHRLEALPETSSFEEIKKALLPSEDSVSEKWLDLFGLFASEDEIIKLTDSIKSGAISSVTGLQDALKAIYLNYGNSGYTWCIGLLKRFAGIDIHSVSKEQLAGIIGNWKSNAIKLNNMVLKDAEKEFDRHSKIGFGHDGDESVVDEDFRNIRGDYTNNKFVLSVRKSTDLVTSNADRLIAMIHGAG